jgi:hypothetical protein
MLHVNKNMTLTLLILERIVAIDGGRLTRQFCRCTKERVADDGCIGAIAAHRNPRSGVLVGDEIC